MGDKDTDDIELVDLGDATVETKQCAPLPLYPDSHFGWGAQPWPSYPGQCG